MSSLDVAFAIDDDSWERVLENAEAVCDRAANAAVVAGGGTDIGAWLELSLVLTDNETVRKLNRAWRAKDSATNVLSFPGLGGGFEPTPEGAPVLLGDVVLAYGICVAEAERDGVALADHVSHLVVHGVLHLLGYDHELPADAEEMEALEIAILADLGIDNPYQGELDRGDLDADNKG